MKNRRKTYKLGLFLLAIWVIQFSCLKNIKAADISTESVEYMSEYNLMNSDFVLEDKEHTHINSCYHEHIGRPECKGGCYTQNAICGYYTYPNAEICDECEGEGGLYKCSSSYCCEYGKYNFLHYSECTGIIEYYDDTIDGEVQWWYESYLQTQICGVCGEQPNCPTNSWGYAIWFGGISQWGKTIWEEAECWCSNCGEYQGTWVAQSNENEIEVSDWVIENYCYSCNLCGSDRAYYEYGEKCGEITVCGQYTSSIIDCTFCDNGVYIHYTCTGCNKMGSQNKICYKPQYILGCGYGEYELLCKIKKKGMSYSAYIKEQFEATGNSVLNCFLM